MPYIAKWTKKSDSAQKVTPRAVDFTQYTNRF